MTRPVPPPRLAVLFARRADVAVIFRRGPSKRVEVISWDTVLDTFQRGHWFHGRIYERRCDLSPDGALLVYFASKFNRFRSRNTDFTHAWTAVSRPPWLTALALWPKGDCWHGGGLFTDNCSLVLNHHPEAAVPHPEHRPRGLEVKPDPAASGEDDPLYSRRLDRDGWVVRQEWAIEQRSYPHFYRTATPQVRARSHPDRRNNLAVVMERRIDGLTYRETFRVEGADAPIVLPGAGVDWLDWDRSGRLVMLHNGTVSTADVIGGAVSPFRELVDLIADTPEERVAPPAAKVW